MKNNVYEINLLTTLTEVEEKLQPIIDKNHDEISKFEQEVETAKVAKVNAAKEAEEAKKGADLETYTELLEVSRKANDEFEFYSGKVDKLKNEPLINEQDYKEYTDLIKSELDKLNRSKKLEAQDLLRELLVIETELNINITKGNELLATLQDKLLKDDASMTTGSGRKVRMNHLENRYKDYSMIQAISSIVNSGAANGVIFKK